MKYYLISDSHSRAFSYNSAFIPLFIGRGDTTLFLTDDLFRSTAKKIISIVTLLKDNVPIIFAFNETNLRLHLNDAYKTWDEGDAVIEKIVGRQLKLFELFCKSGRKVYIITAFPREDAAYTRLAKLYNIELLKQVKQTSVTIINFFDKITHDTGQIIADYKADFIHCNAKVGDLVAGMLGEKKDTDYQWYYKYSFKTDNALSFNIWGDFDKNNLFLKDGKKRKQSQYQRMTKITNRCLRSINKFLKPSFLADLNINIIGAKEGYVALNLNVEDGFNINCYEEDMERVENFQYINFNHANIVFNKDWDDLYKTNKNVSILLLDPQEQKHLNEKLEFMIHNSLVTFFLDKNNSPRDYDRSRYQVYSFPVLSGLQDDYRLKIILNKNNFTPFSFLRIKLWIAFLCIRKKIKLTSKAKRKQSQTVKRG